MEKLYSKVDTEDTFLADINDLHKNEYKAFTKSKVHNIHNIFTKSDHLQQKTQLGLYYMLWIKGRNLESFKLFGKPNPLIGVFLKNPETELYVQLGRTEAKFEQSNPEFCCPIVINRKHMKINLPKKIEEDEVIDACWPKMKYIIRQILEYFHPSDEEMTEETFQNLSFIVCDIDVESKGHIQNENVIGWSNCRYDDVSEQATSLNVSFGTRSMGSLVVTPEVTNIDFLKQMYNIKMSMSGVVHPSQVWFKLSRTILGNLHPIYCSEYVDCTDDRDVEWKDFDMNYAQLANSDDDVEIVFEFYCVNSGEQRILHVGQFTRLASITFTIQDLKKSKGFPIKDDLILKIINFEQKLDGK